MPSAPEASPPLRCLLCSSNGPFRSWYTKEGYDIRECAACHLVQLAPSPSPETLRALYEDAAYFTSGGAASGYTDYAGQQREYLATFREDVRRLAQFMPAGRVLDVGCGYGYFLDCALQAGYDAVGIDVSAPAIAAAAQRHRGRAFVGSIDSAAGIEGERFDAIFASHLIEHVLDPVAFLEAAARRLRPGGVLMLVTPNVESLLARVSGARWVSFKIPEHVSYFAPRTMAELLRRSGYRLLARDPAFQHYPLPFVVSRLRQLFAPASRLVPAFESWRPFRERAVRVTSGSMRVISTLDPRREG